MIRGKSYEKPVVNNENKADWVRSTLERHEVSLLRYAASITGDAERARDVVQDTFIRLCAEDPAELEGKLTEWLFTVCRNRALDTRRKEKRMTTLTEIDLETRDSGEPPPAASAEKREEAKTALHFLEALPPNQREVIRLKFQDGLSYQEISRVTNLSVSNVGFLIHTGIKTLREKFNTLEGATKSQENNRAKGANQSAAPTERNMTAQGNALGKPNQNNSSPERAK